MKFISEKFIQKTFWLLLFIGIALRFYVQFIHPTFNVDEVALCKNLKYLTYTKLLYPLNGFQSAPPLYLWIQKTIITLSPFDFYISAKLLSFCSSIAILFLFNDLIKKQRVLVRLLLLSIMLFNPYIIYHTLTIKQYTIDLLITLILVLSFEKSVFKRYGWLFFGVWCLLSNIGLFAISGYLIYLFLKNCFPFKSFKIIPFLRANGLVFLAPLPFISYYLWYSRQSGALELKNFMLNYWSINFISLDSQFFRHVAAIAYEIWVSVFCAVDFWGFFLMLLTLALFYFVIKKQAFLFKQELLLLSCMFIVHVLFNILRLYPLADRLILYVTPLFLLALGASITLLMELDGFKRFSKAILLTFSVITIGFYSLYFPFKENDVIGLFDKVSRIDKGSNPIYVTYKASHIIKSFNRITDNKFIEIQNRRILEIDSNLNQSKYLISKTHKYLRYDKKPLEDSTIKKLIFDKKLIKIDSVDGYTIYKIPTKK
jgi:hypothetical protein